MSCPGSTQLVGGGKRKRRTMKKSKSLRRKGKRSVKRTRRSKKGGFFGGIIEQAIVPFGLFALQKKMHNRKITKKSKLSKKKKN